MIFVPAETIDRDQLRENFLAQHDLSFAIANPAHHGESVIYITNDPNLGKLDFIVANNSGMPIEIRPESVLEIFASPPLEDSDMRRIQPASQDWTVTLGQDRLELRCTSRTIVASGDRLTIPLANVMASCPAGTGFFVFDYSHFSGIEDGSKRSPQIFIQRPAKANPAPLQAGLGARAEYAGQQGATVYVTPWTLKFPDKGIENYFVVQIVNTRADKPIPADPQLDSRIVISFTSGNSNWSVCGDEQIKVATCQMTQIPASGAWEIAKDTGGPVPVWTMRPPRGVNVFDGGGLVAFQFDGIISQLPPKFAAPMFVQFVNIPGYDDGYAVATLQKIEPVPYVRRLDAYSGARKIAPEESVGYREKITLQWDVFAAETVRISDQNAVFSPVQGTDVYPSTSPILYSLNPEVGGDSRDGWKKELRLTVSPPIAKLEAPEAVAPEVTFSLQWKCSNGSHCLLTGNGLKQENLPLAGSTHVQVTDTSTFTITCMGAGSASAEATVRAPPPEVTTSVEYEKDSCTLRWSTKFATRVRVLYMHVWVSMGAEGSLTIHRGNQKFEFEVIAFGKGTAKKVIEVPALRAEE